VKAGAGRVSAREVEVDGELTVEVRLDGVVCVELTWSGIPSRGAHPGWTPVAPDSSARAGPDWPWDAREERELAAFEDALHDHRTRPGERSAMRVDFWERRARDASAVGAADWACAWLAARRGV
jgi:hypothetical protein